MKTTVMFTVLPRGRSGSKLLLSLFVTPKFVDAVDGTALGTTLLADWPSIIRAASYRAIFTYPEINSVGVPDPNAAEASLRFDSALWRQVLPGRTPIQKFASKRYERASFASFRTQTIHEDLSSLYRGAAGSLERPSIGPGGTAGLGTRVNDVASTVADTTSAGGKLVLGPGDANGMYLSKDELEAGEGSPPKQEYLRAAVFYNHDDWRKEAGVARPEPPADSAPTMEFHKVIGALGDHPSLLRRLGLVIDLVCDEPLDAGSAGSIRVLVTLPSGTGIEVICPWTLYTLTSTDFTAAFLPEPKNAEGTDVDIGSSLLSNNGMLPLDSAAYLVTHLDVDHAATEFIDFAKSTAKTLADRTSSGALSVGLPALRTVGFGIYRDDREAVMAPRLNRAHVYEEAPNALNFIADELVRGYRFDVSENGGAWRSLCERVTSADVGSGGAPLTITDEGFVKASAMSTTNRAQDMFNIHESICRWNGWSLVAKRPGRSVCAVPREDGTQDEEADFVDHSGDAVGMPVALDVRARPGSLTRLRFGRSYRFRARAVDLAGNDLSHNLPASPAPGDHASSELAFKRYEPVTQPVLNLRSKLTEGESLEHVVIRSNPYGQTPQDPTAWAAAANRLPAKEGYLLGPLAPYAGTSERHVAPPKTSYQLAELHGALDPLLSTGSLSVEQKVRKSWAIATKEEGTFYDATLMDVRSYPPTERSSGAKLVTPAGVSDIADQPRRRGDALPTGQYVIYPEDGVRLPYLPDPNAPGFAIHDLPTGPYKYAFSGSWPELDPARLVVTDGAALEVRTGSDSTVTLKVPPATRLSLRYSSTVAHPELMEFASNNLSGAIADGKHALLSPARDIVVVHAVQQPDKPTMRSLDLVVSDRARGETAVSIAGPIGVHGPSTNHVELVSTWQEIHDTFSDSDVDPRESPTRYRNIICALPVEYDQGDTAVPAGTVQSFGDTKRRDVTYKAVATTRYREYFPPTITVHPENVTNASGDVLRIIRSSARPPAPRVLYTVPSFKWTETRSETGGLATIVKKRNGCLRVYVDRGWFASGADERLAVVLQPKGTAVTRPDLVSVWGNDPVWFARNDLTMLDEDSFVFDPAQRDTFSVIRDVATAEEAGKVTVATFKPEWHKERKLWFFDIQMDAKASYFPFVRLALARVQPYSVDDLRLSGIVLAEFTQLSAQRTTTLTPTSDQSAYEVRVEGISGSNLDLKLPGFAPDPVTGLWPAAASGRVLKVELQQSSTTRGDELDYRVLGNVETLLAYAAPGSSAEKPLLSFRGTLRIPSNVDPSVPHRVVVRELEQFATDDEVGVSKGNAVIKVGGTVTPYTERLIYVDAITVNL